MFALVNTYERGDAEATLTLSAVCPNFATAGNWCILQYERKTVYNSQSK